MSTYNFYNTFHAICDCNECIIEIEIPRRRRYRNPALLRVSRLFAAAAIGNSDQRTGSQSATHPTRLRSSSSPKPLNSKPASRQAPLQPHIPISPFQTSAKVTAASFSIRRRRRRLICPVPFCRHRSSRHAPKFVRLRQLRMNFVPKSATR